MFPNVAVTLEGGIRDWKQIEPTGQTGAESVRGPLRVNNSVMNNEQADSDNC
jgi:hypothetical protein